MTLDEFKEYTKRILVESEKNELEFNITHNKLIDIAEKQKDLISEWYDALYETEEETECSYRELCDMGYNGVHWLASEFAC